MRNTLQHVIYHVFFIIINTHIIQGEEKHANYTTVSSCRRRRGSCTCTRRQKTPFLRNNK